MVRRKNQNSVLVIRIDTRRIAQVTPIIFTPSHNNNRQAFPPTNIFQFILQHLQHLTTTYPIATSTYPIT